MKKQKKTILIGITGGIAAYKICSLVSSLTKRDFEVHVIMSKEACEFVTPLTLQTLSKQKVHVDMFDQNYQFDVEHISLAKKADLFVVAPATANVIAKIAHGMADDMLTTTFLASTCRKLVVPAMNCNMYENPITQDNLAKLKSYGIEVMDTSTGYLACGDVGKGRMPEAETIEDAIDSIIEDDRFLNGKKVLITCGPTREEIDPVRYITNHSTGKMGVSLAKAARNYGADVVLVSGMVTPPDLYGIQVESVSSSQQMLEKVLQYQKEMDAFILAAAVADYTPKEKADHKIHKTDDDLYIELKRTTDILKTLGDTRRKDQVLVGFSMETENLIENSRKKLDKKKCDYIVANSLAEKGAGFGTDTNVVTLISKNHEERFGLLTKDETAKEILKRVFLKGARL